MKAILEFDLNDDNDKERYEDTYMGRKYAIALGDIKQEIMGLYENDQFSNGIDIEGVGNEEIIGGLYHFFRQTLSALNIDWDEL